MDAKYLGKNMCFEKNITLLHIDDITFDTIFVTRIKYRDATTVLTYGIPKNSWNNQYQNFKQISLKKFFKEIFIG